MRLVKWVLWLGLLFITGMAQATKLRIATLSPDGSAWMLTLRQAAAEIQQKTAGRVDIHFYTGGTMGNDRTVLSKIRLGELQGGALTISSMDTYVKDVDLYSLPMLFNTYADVDRARAVMDSVLSRELEAAGWVNFGFAEGGFAYLLSHRLPVASVVQLRSHKVWIPEGDSFSETVLKLMRITPVPLSLVDVLPGLQGGMIDVVASSPIATLALQWQTQVRYLTDLPISYICGVLVLSQRDFMRLTPSDQQTVRLVMTQAFKVLNQKNREDNLSAYKALLGQGITVVKTSAQQRHEWQLTAQQVIEGMEKRGLVSVAGFQQIQQALRSTP